jgi:ubiquinone/menaquinone biosynthesis C-methylase UbiE
VQQGDFTALAKDYAHRPGYSPVVLRALAAYVGAYRPAFVVADVGAGTGKLTEGLAALGLRGFAIEPNAAMLAEGTGTGGAAFEWREGSAECLPLPEHSVDWITMASSFHWTRKAEALKEFRRVLRPRGFLTVMWNPRDLDAVPLQRRIDDMVREVVPELRRVSSGRRAYTENLEAELRADGLFDDVLFTEACERIEMPRARYLGAWRSVNDIQAQAGPPRFAVIMARIEAMIGDGPTVAVAYRTRAWTVQGT